MADHRAHVVYRRLLSRTGHGYPLWIPDPDENLPEAYRKDGISIGDVGLLTEDGGFDFLFNVHRPVNDAVSSGGVSWDVLPLAAFNDSHPIRKTSFIHKEKSAITSAHVAKQSIVMSGSADTVVFGGGGFAFQFNTKKAQAAVLMLPGGAHRYEAKNRSIYEKYASENGIAWYTYANVTLGRGASNGSLYLVTGCDKCCSWGTAAVSKPEETREVSLRFVAPGMTEGGMALNASWSTEFGTEARCFPPRSIRVQDRENQCVFVRGITISVKENLLRRSVRVEVGRWSGVPEDSRHRLFGSQSPAFPRSMSSHSPSPSNSSSSCGHSGHSGLDSDSLVTRGQPLQFDSDGETDDYTSDSDVEVSRFPLYSAEPHISSRIANHIVSKRSDVDIAVVNDEAWLSVVNEDSDFQIESDEGLLEQVLKGHYIDVSDGTARLRQQLDIKAATSNDNTDGMSTSTSNASRPGQSASSLQGFAFAKHEAVPATALATTRTTPSPLSAGSANQLKAPDSNLRSPSKRQGYTSYPRLRPMEVQPMEGKHRCPECKFSFVSAASRNVHVDSVHRNIEYYCDLCDRAYQYPLAVKRHRSSEHPSESYDGKPPQKRTRVLES